MNDKMLSAITAACNQLPNGALLISGDSTRPNPMTIGWATFGIVWGKPICSVFVRYSRFSHELMENNEYFSVAVPDNGDMKDVLGYCGTISGRDKDKCAELSLATHELNNGIAIDKCKYNIICRKVFKAEGSLDNMDAEIRSRYYGANQVTSDGDPHVIYFGEIVAVEER